MPISAVAYAAGMGLSTPDLDALLKPAVPFKEQMARAMASVAEFPDFSSPMLRDDVAELQAMSLEVMANSIATADVEAFMVRMSGDIDNLWYQTYDQLQADVSAWGSPGSFGAHASTLLQTYQAFLSGSRVVRGAGMVLQGVGDADARQKLIQADGVFEVATSQFVGRLSPLAHAAWDALQAEPANQQFAVTIQQAITVALTGAPSPYAGDIPAAGAAMAPGLDYLSDLSNLVVVASQDLHDSALAQSTKATDQFANDIALLALLVVVVLGGVIVAARVLTRPLGRLADMAQRVHDGDFDLERLPDTGPREIGATTKAFNEMASTLKAVESAAVALAAEDVSHMGLSIPLPGRTGHALQAT
ncbi:MAG: HAMP domain-containing protein, partial [Actinomycetota bacterium]|nr:HAMP domain-containing protein [Actinomycetota bacterium]